MISSDLTLNDNAKGLNDTIFEYTPGLVKKRYKRCAKCRGFGHSATVCPNKRAVTLEEARQIDQMLKAKRLEHNLNALIREHEEEKRAAQEQYFELSKSTFQVLNTSKGEVLDSSPIFDSYEEQSEPLLNLFPKDHGVEVDEERAFDPYPTHDLFHDAPIDHEICELNDPPIFDSYELEDGVVNLLGAVANEEVTKAVLKPFGAILGQQGPDALKFDPNPLRDELEHEHSDLNALHLKLFSLDTVQKELNQTYSLLRPATQEQPMLGDSFVIPFSTISSFKSSEQSVTNSFKNCYAFKKKGMLSEAELQPRVHLDQAFGALELNQNQLQVQQVQASANTCSGYHELTIKSAKSEHVPFLSSDATLGILWFFGYGLLDYYIEDDELKDVRKLLLLLQPLKVPGFKI